MDYYLSEPSFKKPSLGEGDLERAIKLTEGIRFGQQVLQTKHTDVSLVITSSTDGRVSYHVDINGKKDHLTEATSAFIQSAGVPDFVVSGYDIVDEILAKFGKKTQRKFIGCLVGKHVVDM